MTSESNQLSGDSRRLRNSKGHRPCHNGWPCLGCDRVSQSRSISKILTVNSKHARFIEHQLRISKVTRNLNFYPYSNLLQQMNFKTLWDTREHLTAWMSTMTHYCQCFRCKNNTGASLSFNRQLNIQESGFSSRWRGGGSGEQSEGKLAKPRDVPYRLPAVECSLEPMSTCDGEVPC